MELHQINLALPSTLSGELRSALVNGSSSLGRHIRQVYAETSGQQQMHFALNVTDDEDEEAELLVMGYVGDFFDGLAADQVVRQLEEIGNRRVNVRINSPGGFAFDGLTIFNALLKHKGDVITTVEGLAGSAASLIAMGGNPVRMMANSSMFIHRSLGLALGNAAVMRDVADFLDSVDDGILETYVSKTGLAKRKVNELMDGKVDGTTMTAKEAKSLGFADEVVELKRRKKASNFSVTTTFNGGTTTSTAVPVDDSSAVQLIVPSNPPGGDRYAVSATWEHPELSEFTADDWENVGPNTRAAISRHFAVVPADLSEAAYDDLLLPHHDADGNPVISAVTDALDSLESLPASVAEEAEEHLRAHMPPDRTLQDAVQRRMVELRLMEIGA